eukprot:1394665-Pyramimonas_sp.AAC.1
MLATRELVSDQNQESWRGRRMQETARLSRQGAKCRSGARHRDGRRLGITTLSKDEWLSVWQLEGGSWRNAGTRTAVGG